MDHGSAPIWFIIGRRSGNKEASILIASLASAQIEKGPALSARPLIRLSPQRGWIWALGREFIPLARKSQWVVGANVKS